MVFSSGLGSVSMIAGFVSSSWIVPSAVAVVILAPPVGLDSVTVNSRSPWAVVFPATSTSISFWFSPAANVTVPFVSALPVKSAATAAETAPELALPVTAQFTKKTETAFTTWLPKAVRWITNRNGFGPLLPSLRFAKVAMIDRFTSSSRIVPVAAAVPIVAPALGLESVTVNGSSGSGMVSPATLTVMSLLVSFAAKLSVPLGKPGGEKSLPSTDPNPTALTAQFTCTAVPTLALRVTVKVNGVTPVLPSALSASVAAMSNCAGTKTSSFWIVPKFCVTPLIKAPTAPESVTRNCSSGSTAESPFTLMVMSFADSPAAKVTVPDGNALPTKSAAFAGFTPKPVTAQFTVETPETLTVRRKGKTNAVPPPVPSAWLGCVSGSVKAIKGVVEIRFPPTATLYFPPIGLPSVSAALPSVPPPERLAPPTAQSTPLPVFPPAVRTLTVCVLFAARNPHAATCNCRNAVPSVTNTEPCEMLSK